MTIALNHNAHKTAVTHPKADSAAAFKAAAEKSKLAAQKLKDEQARLTHDKTGTNPVNHNANRAYSIPPLGNGEFQSMLNRLAGPDWNYYLNNYPYAELMAICLYQAEALGARNTGATAIQYYKSYLKGQSILGAINFALGDANGTYGMHWDKLTNAQRLNYNNVGFNLVANVNNTVHQLSLMQTDADQLLTRTTATQINTIYKEQPKFDYFISRIGTYAYKPVLDNFYKVFAPKAANVRIYNNEVAAEKKASTGPVRTLLSDQTWGVSINGQRQTITLSGGLWAHSDLPLTADAQYLGSDVSKATNAANALKKGSTVQYLLQHGYNAGDINFAFELLGISNRQIGAYAKAAAIGGVGNSGLFGTHRTAKGSAAFYALTVALRMRAAILNYPDSGNAGSGILSLPSAESAVVQGVKSANVFKYPDQVAEAMIYGMDGASQAYIAITEGESAFGGAGSYWGERNKHPNYKQGRAGAQTVLKDTNISVAGEAIPNLHRFTITARVEKLIQAAINGDMKQLNIKPAAKAVAMRQLFANVTNEMYQLTGDVQESARIGYAVTSAMSTATTVVTLGFIISKHIDTDLILKTIRETASRQVLDKIAGGEQAALGLCMLQAGLWAGTLYYANGMEEGRNLTALEDGFKNIPTIMSGASTGSFGAIGLSAFLNGKGKAALGQVIDVSFTGSLLANGVNNIVENVKNPHLSKTEKGFKIAGAASQIGAGVSSAFYNLVNLLEHLDRLPAHLNNRQAFINQIKYWLALGIPTTLIAAQLLLNGVGNALHARALHK